MNHERAVTVLSFGGAEKTERLTIYKTGVVVDRERALWLRVLSVPAEDKITVKITNTPQKVKIYRKYVEIKFMTEINFKSV